MSKAHHFWLSEAVKMADTGHLLWRPKRGKYLFGNRVRQTKHRDRHSLCEVQSYFFSTISPSYQVVTKMVMIKYLQTKNNIPWLFKMCSHGNVKYFIFNMFILACPTNWGKLTGCVQLHGECILTNTDLAKQKMSPWMRETNMLLLKTCVKPSKGLWL